MIKKASKELKFLHISAASTIITITLSCVIYQRVFNLGGYFPIVGTVLAAAIFAVLIKISSKLIKSTKMRPAVMVSGVFACAALSLTFIKPNEAVLLFIAVITVDDLILNHGKRK